MAVSDGAEELAILLQETVEELKQQRELNQQLKVLMEQNSKQLADATARGNQAECNSRPRRSATQVAVSLETRNRVHSIYKGIVSRGENVTGWNFSQKFDSAFNQELVQTIKQEVLSINPEADQKEISCACKTYFRSLKDDNRRETKGALTAHRKDLKVKKRIKQKLKHRKSVLTEAAHSLKWTSVKLDRVRSLLSEEYMSSETSADESDTDSETNSYKVRDIPWLRKRYKQAFHALDRFYTNNKMSNRSKKMTHSRVRSKHPSERCMPGTVPTWAVREAYRSDENSVDSSVLNTSGSSESVDSS